MLEIGAAVLLILATVLVHGFGTFYLISTVVKHWHSRWQQISIFRTQLLLARIVLLLFVLHMAEAAIWAGFYVWSGALSAFHKAMYFSVCSYTTVGYGDVVLAPRWWMLGAFEACIGVLMMGWSTGILLAVVSRQIGVQVRKPKEGEETTEEG